MFLAILLTCALPQGRVEGGLPASPPQSSDQGNKPIFWAENVAIRRCGWVLRWTISNGLRLPPVSAFESALVALSGGWISPCSGTTRRRASTPGCMDGWMTTSNILAPEAEQCWGGGATQSPRGPADLSSACLEQRPVQECTPNPTPCWPFSCVIFTSPPPHLIIWEHLQVNTCSRILVLRPSSGRINPI